MFTTFVSIGYFLMPVLIVLLSIYWCHPSYSMRKNTCLSLGIIAASSVGTGILFALIVAKPSSIDGAIICMLILSLLLYSVPLACIFPQYHPITMLLKEYIYREDPHRYQSSLQRQEPAVVPVFRKGYHFVISEGEKEYYCHCQACQCEINNVVPGQSKSQPAEQQPEQSSSPTTKEAGATRRDTQTQTSQTKTHTEGTPEGIETIERGRERSETTLIGPQTTTKTGDEGKYDGGAAGQ